MAEISRFWNSPSVGDSVEAPYDADTEFSEVLLALVGANRTSQKSGVLLNVLNEYLITPSAGSVAISPGESFVWGTWHRSDAPVLFTITAPTVASRYDRFVLRKDWDAQTVRITRITGAEGGGVPALTQIVGGTWDFLLGDIVTTTGGVSTIVVANEGRLYYPLPNTTMPSVQVFRTTNQAIANGGSKITWESGSNVKDIIWVAGAPTRLTMARGGLYHLEAFLYFSAFNGNERGLTALINGEVFTLSQVSGFQTTTGGSQRFALSCDVELAKNDYVEIHAYQNTGAPLDLLAVAHTYFPLPRARMRFIRPLGVA